MFLKKRQLSFFLYMTRSVRISITKIDLCDVTWRISVPEMTMFEWIPYISVLESNIRLGSIVFIGSFPSKHLGFLNLDDNGYFSIVILVYESEVLRWRSFAFSCNRLHDRNSLALCRYECLHVKLIFVSRRKFP